MRAIALAVVLAALTVPAVANVLNMGGTRSADGSWTGLASLETVPVGNPGNGPHQFDPGAVGYEYSIGKYEVTAGQYTEFLNAVAGVDTHSLYNPLMWSNTYGCKIERFAGSGTAGDPYHYQVAGDWANRPVNFVSWGDAVRFANWLHNGQSIGIQSAATTEDGAYRLNGATTSSELMAATRTNGATWALPTDDEWFKAAYHKNDGVTAHYFDYPTSSNTIPSNRLIGPDPGNNATFNASIYTLDYTIGGPYFRTEVGAHENSDSPYGTFDQGGNVGEWNEGRVPDSSSYRDWRGGAFNAYHQHLKAGVLSGTDPTREFETLGFRVAQVPEPATLSLLALGALALLRRRK